MTYSIRRYLFEGGRDGNGVAVDAPPRSTVKDRVAKTRSLRHWARLAVAVFAFAALVTFLYVLGLHEQWANADLVRGLLMGRSVAHGNVLLNHWYSSTDSFWTIDVGFFAIGVLLVGMKVT